jgi:putative ABC transport system ATP-binding protein
MSALLKVQNVYLSYTSGSNQVKVLQGINLDVNSSESISVMGESGSGKTSLIMLISGLERVSSGNIIFQDRDITKLSEDELAELRRKHIGIVFQSYYLIPNYSALENVCLTLEINKEKNIETKAKEILARFGLKERFNNLPSQLSGGEQQRVAIARSLVVKPSLILADEPTGNLDSENSKMISDMLINYVREENSSLVLVTHDDNLASRAQRKIKIKDGKVI